MYEPNMYALLFPEIILLMALQGLGLIVTALTTKYRDLVSLLRLESNMYTTPVIYPYLLAPRKYSDNLLSTH